MHCKVGDVGMLKYCNRMKSSKFEFMIISSTGIVGLSTLVVGSLLEGCWNVTREISVDTGKCLSLFVCLFGFFLCGVGGSIHV